MQGDILNIVAWVNNKHIEKEGLAIYNKISNFHRVQFDHPQEFEIKNEYRLMKFENERKEIKIELISN